MINPLLYNGRKFDIRTYMLVSINNGKLRAYWYQDGYIRTSSYMWRLDEINDNYIHLTNDAIQKYTNDYGKYEPANKLTYSELQRYLDTLPKTATTKYNFQG
jgi:tubulin polyglutamylase TTLL1/tubulin monoglycylase TTLL3/8